MGNNMLYQPMREKTVCIAAPVRLTEKYGMLKQSGEKMQFLFDSFLHSPDGEEGFPSSMDAEVTYG
jgi:hypothetical protein